MQNDSNPSNKKKQFRDKTEKHCHQVVEKLVDEGPHSNAFAVCMIGSEWGKIRIAVKGRPDITPIEIANHMQDFANQLRAHGSAN